MSLSNSTPGLRDSMSGYNGSNIDVIQMISLVKENPPIWDPNNPAYRKRDVKCQIWNRICSNLCPNWNYFNPQTQAEIIDDVKDGWNYLQENYMKFLNGTEENGRIQVAYHSYLDFLRPCSMLIHNTSGNIPTSAPESPQPSTSSEVTPSAQSKRRRSAPAGGQGSIVQKKAPTRRPKAEPEDQWTFLGNSVAKRLRDLPESRQWSCVPAIFEVMDLYACDNIPENGTIITGIHNLRTNQSPPTSAPEKRRKSKDSAQRSP